MAYLDYTKLRYKYLDNNEQYRIELNLRQENSLTLPLMAKNGQNLKFVMCDELSQLISEIEKIYDRAEVDPVKFITDEAFSTCTIEGAKSTIADTINLEKGKSPSNHSEKMIKNNIQAIKSISDNGFEFTEDNILSLWNIITEDVADNPEIQGDKYRIGDVVIADSMGNITFYAPLPGSIDDMMSQLISFANSDDNLNNFIKSVIIHYYFVYIHPFCDGNGRCARLLLQNYLIKCGFDKFKGISISTGVLQNKSGYYRALENSENEYNDITFIIIYYLETILDVLYKACSGFGYNERNMELNNRQKQVLTYLRKSKGNIITADIYAKRYNTNIETAKSELSSLAAAGLLTIMETSKIEYKAK